MTIQNHFCVRCGNVWLRKGSTTNPQHHPILCKECLIIMYLEVSH
jgi:hypothetical protein